MATDGQQDTRPGYALRVADESHEWYRTHAQRSRFYYRATEIAVLLMSAGIPVAVAISPERTAITALLGASVAVASGLEAIFHWRDNYLRYSQAREDVEAERRRYKTTTGAYEDPATRDQALVQQVTSIEHDEMRRWLRISSPQASQ